MRVIIALLFSLLAFFSCAISHGGELGDAITSDESRDIFFASLDNNGNGKITVDELTGYIEGTGGNSLDEISEIQSAVSNVLRTLDLNEDKILKKDDFAVYWKSLSSLLSVEEVADWVEHALLMPPAVVRSFIDNAITGYDFMELLANNGALLEQELHIPRITTRRRLIRGIKMKLLGMGTPPTRPPIPRVLSTEKSSCFTHLHLSWTSDGETSGAVNAFPVHRYQLLRQATSPPGVVGNQRAPWVTVYEGPDTSVIDALFTPPVAVGKALADSQPSLPPQLYTYRLSAWNMIGRSELVYLKFELAAATLDLSKGGVATDCELLAQPALSEYFTHAGSATRIRPGLESSFTAREVMSAEPTPVAVSRDDTGEGGFVDASRFGQAVITGNSNIEKSRSVLAAVWAIVRAMGKAVCAGSSMLFIIIQALAFVITAMISYIRFRSIWRYKGSSGAERQQRASAPKYMLDGAMVWFVGCVFDPFINCATPAVISFFRWIGRQYPVTVSTTTHLADMVLSLQRMVQVHVAEDPTGERISVPATTRQPSSISVGYYSSGDEGPDVGEHAEEGGENYKSCSICLKNFKFKWAKFKWRKRHHCSRCLNMFCSSCGIVTHNRFLQCPVPGTCKCMKCAGIIGQASSQVGGIAVPYTELAGGSARHGVGVVSTAALEMHNRAIPPAEFHGSCGSDDDFPATATSSLSVRSTSLVVNCDSRSCKRELSGGYSSTCGPGLEVDLSWRCRETAAAVGPDDTTTQPSTGSDLSRGHQLRDHSFSSLRHLIGFHDANSNSAAGIERSRKGNTSLIGASNLSPGRKPLKGLPPKPPLSSCSNLSSTYQSTGSGPKAGGVQTPSPSVSSHSTKRLAAMTVALPCPPIR